MRHLGPDLARHQGRRRAVPALLFAGSRFAWPKLLAIGFGTGGFVVLFGPEAAEGWLSGNHGATQYAWSAFAVALAAITYSAGFVVARPLLRTYPSTLLAGVTTLIGMLVLLGAAWLAMSGREDAVGVEPVVRER